ncbi:unnamed protein product, partial [Cuscuta campestris]
MKLGQWLIHWRDDMKLGQWQYWGSGSITI